VTIAAWRKIIASAQSIIEHLPRNQHQRGLNDVTTGGDINGGKGIKGISE